MILGTILPTSGQTRHLAAGGAPGIPGRSPGPTPFCCATFRPFAHTGSNCAVSVPKKLKHLLLGEPTAHGMLQEPLPTDSRNTDKARDAGDELLGAGASGPTKPRIPYACEACRVAKVKCQGGSAEGTCRRYGIYEPRLEVIVCMLRSVVLCCAN